MSAHTTTIRGLVINGFDGPGIEVTDAFSPSRSTSGTVIEGILERFAALPKHGRKRRYLARSKEELYPDSPHLADNAYEVRPRWWVDTHASRAGIETRIKMACEVAGVEYGKDLVVNLG